MKKLILSVVLVVLSLISSVSMAQVSGGGGGGSSTLPVGPVVVPEEPLSANFHFIYPKTNQVWYPGQVCAVGFSISNMGNTTLDGYVNLELTSIHNPNNSHYISGSRLEQTGPQYEYFTLRRSINPGDYRIVARIWDYVADRSLMVTSSVVITIANAVISPAHGDLIRTGKKVRVKLAFPVSAGDTATVHLVGSGLGEFSRLSLGVIKAGGDRLIATIPTTLPNKEPLLSGGDYQIVVREWSTWLQGETFRVFNPELNLPIPLVVGSGGGGIAVGKY